MKKSVKKLVMAALLTALVCVATMIVKIPSPLKGYINLGDCVVLISGWLLQPGYGFLAAGLGSALADILSGYVSYAPATFVIKGLMAIAVYFIYKFMRKKLSLVPAAVVAGIVAEIIMISGYFIFEGFLYGFGASLVNIPANAVQGIAGIIAGTGLIKIFDKSKFSLN
jgi:uncharacterized membrane protein